MIINYNILIDSSSASSSIAAVEIVDCRLVACQPDNELAPFAADAWACRTDPSVAFAATPSAADTSDDRDCCVAAAAAAALAAVES